ncbi:MAG: FAD-binding oxidoreductase [Candidatus Hodarchaeota archaeon]
MSELYKKLENIVSEKYISNNLIIRHAYSRNVDPVLQGIPDIVIRPKDTKEISEILKIANEENVPVIPRGGGCCEQGGSKPIEDGGIVLEIKQMNKILNLDEENLIVTVEAGISWAELNDYLGHYGLYTGCMGASSGRTASIGGGISHYSSGGGGAYKYGSCTDHVASLEVVLPTGEIIETGSQANKFSKKPFNRFGNGPDLTGLFCGDNGIMGVKTKISLHVYPKPPFAGYKTFLMHRKSQQATVNIFSEICHKGYEVYDAYYLDDLLVRFGCEVGLYPIWDNVKRKKAIFFYTVEANSEVELNEKIKQLNKIIISQKCEELGPEISDGNIAKWHYVENGYWQLYHNLWGMVPGYEPLSAECSVPISRFPEVLREIGQWEIKNNEDINKIEEITKFRPIAGSGPISLEKGNIAGLSTGFNTFSSYFEGKIYDFIEQINLKLWRSLLERLARFGVQWFMMGDFLSRVMVDIGGYSTEYYKFMSLIKKSLDPKCILSRGKFNFWGDK